MKKILLSAIFLLLAINVLLSLPRAVDLIQTKVVSSNVAEGVAFSRGEVAAVEKVVLPPKDKGTLPPPLSAAAAVIKDMGSDNILYSKSADTRLPIASTTKIMTALVAVEYFKPGDILEVPDDLGNINGSSMGLKAGEQMTFRSILFGMLLNSGNDAAYTIAENYPGGKDTFIDKMNQKAASLGLLNSHFDNPAGYDSPDHFSTASDLAKIAAVASDNIQIAKVVATRETEVASVDLKFIHPLKNLNKLLDIPGMLGMKTGTTPLARENLVSLMERDGHIVLMVVLGSEDRFGETKKLIDWTFANFTWPT